MTKLDSLIKAASKENQPTKKRFPGKSFITVLVPDKLKADLDHFCISNNLNRSKLLRGMIALVIKENDND